MILTWMRSLAAKCSCVLAQLLVVNFNRCHLWEPGYIGDEHHWNQESDGTATWSREHPCPPVMDLLALGSVLNSHFRIVIQPKFLQTWNRTIKWKSWCVRRSGAVSFSSPTAWHAFWARKYLRRFAVLRIFFVSFENRMHSYLPCVRKWILHLRPAFQISCAEFCRRKWVLIVSGRDIYGANFWVTYAGLCLVCSC